MFTLKAAAAPPSTLASQLDADDVKKSNLGRDFSLQRHIKFSSVGLKTKQLWQIGGESHCCTSVTS